MELTLSGNALKTLARSVTCLARIGTELVIHASSSNLSLHTLNASRSAYQAITLKPDFFDAYSLAEDNHEVQCSVLIKSVCSVLRTPVSALDRLALSLPHHDAPKLQWTLHCLNGVKKTYWISCNVEPEIQKLSLDRQRFPSNLVVRPRDLSRILANFQSSLHEITVIATDTSVMPSDTSGGIGGKAVELRSYIDPAKDNTDAALHTQLWIDPAEEFLQYKHTGDPVDVTFGVKELKAFLSFCEGCEVDIQLFFEKAGEPILMIPRFGFDDSSNSDFDSTLVLATMLISQLREGNITEQPSDAQAPENHCVQGPSQHQHARTDPSVVPSDSSNHTKIWSELSGNSAKSHEANREKLVKMGGNQSSALQPNELHKFNMMNGSHAATAGVAEPDIGRAMERDNLGRQDTTEAIVNPYSQHHPSNWVVEGDDNEEEDESDLYVQSTPLYD